MPKKCQVVRPGCMNFSLDVHEGAVQLPFVPVPTGMYFTVGPTEWIVGNKQNAKVRQTGDGLIKLGHDCEYLRPHLPFPVPCPEVIFWALHSATGSSKTAWGSFKTKHGDDPIALMFLDFDIGWMALINQLNCGDLPINPNVVSIQAPTNVYAGMSLGDVLTCTLQIIVDAVLSKLIEAVSSRVSKWASKKLERTVVGKLVEKSEAFVERSEEKASMGIASKLLKAPLLRGFVDRSMTQRQFRAAAQVLMRSKSNPLRHELAEKAVALVRSRVEHQLTEKLSAVVGDVAEEALSALGERIEKRYDLPVNPVDAVLSPSDTLGELVGEEVSAHYDYIAALIDGRPYSPPEKPPKREAPEPASRGGGGSW